MWTPSWVTWKEKATAWWASAIASNDHVLCFVIIDDKKTKEMRKKDEMKSENNPK